jgi:hypothetical protein
VTTTTTTPFPVTTTTTSGPTTTTTSTQNASIFFDDYQRADANYLNGIGPSDYSEMYTSGTPHHRFVIQSGKLVALVGEATRVELIRSDWTSVANQEMLIKTVIPADTATASLVMTFLLRFVDNSNHYHMVFQVDANFHILQIYKRVSGTYTQIGGPNFTLPTTPLSGESWYIRAQTSGTTIRIKAWNVINAEPAWQLSATDSGIVSAGKYALVAVTGVQFIAEEISFIKL